MFSKKVIIPSVCAGYTILLLIVSVGFVEARSASFGSSIDPEPMAETLLNESNHLVKETRDKDASSQTPTEST